MAEEILKIEADSDGVWLSALSGDITPVGVSNFLRNNGVRKYDAKAVEEFTRQKSRDRFKIAGRDSAEEKRALITVNISKDSMTASVSVEPPFFTNPWPAEAEIFESLERKNVTFGVDQDAVKQLVELKMAEEQIEVAHGTPAVNGDNARIELLLDPDKVPEVDMDAEKIDHRTRSAFLNVKQGDQVAVKHPLTSGKNGTTVAGTEIKAVPGKDALFPIAGGLEISEDGLQLLASLDGRLTRKDNKLIVLPELEVRGDVDFGVGNINFTGSVKILGAVREGFQVLASGNIEIKEMVEGANVESKADIIINGGVRGMGKGSIVAAGNITAGFADQASIRSGGEIKIKNSVFHSHVSANHTVTVMGGQKSQIAGGKIQAGVAVICSTLGSEMGTKTEVIVGLPPELAERRKELLATIVKQKESFEKLEANLNFLKKQEQAGVLDESKRGVMVSATKSKFQIQSSLKAMQEELEELESRLELTKAKGVVRVKDVCYPGVTVTIRGFTYAVRESFKFASFVYDESEGEVKIRSFDS